MKSTQRILVLFAALFVIAGPVSAQVATGTPPFATFGGGPDTIDLANLNAHLTLPVLHKTGRGLPFNYDVTYDSSIWQPVGTTGSQTWEPTNAGSFGWSYSAIGTVLVSGAVTEYCYTIYELPPPYGYYQIETGAEGYIWYTYQDKLGTKHSFPGYVAFAAGTCGNAYAGTPGTATDGSGYVASVNGSGDLTVVDKNGKPVYWSNTANEGDGQLGVPYATDHNGNQITINSSGQFFDTLSSTTPALTVTGTAPSNTTFTYVAPSGANASYTMKYSSYTVKTNFGCSGIAEYGPTAQYLVSEIDLPDGTKYLFTYEATPGYSGDVTGRLASVALPTGGTITYEYAGSNNGIVCADGSTATLKRYTPDTGSNDWTYAHTESGTAWTTTVTDPQGNQTDMDFQGIYLTEKQVYQGTSTLLKTMYDCYNGATVPCNPTAITLPITQQNAVVAWPGGSGLQSKTISSYNSYGMVTEIDQYAYGAGAPGSIVRKTLTNYASLGNGIVNKPSSVTVENGSGSVISETTYQYDQGSVTATSGTPQHVSISGSRGNPTTVSYLVSGSTFLTQTFTYYDTGNIQTETDVNGAQTSYTYGACGNSFPTTISEPLSLSKSLTWNCTGGVTTSVTDENGKTQSYAYATNPDFWWPNSSTDQESNVTNFAYTGQTSVESSLLFNGSSSTTDVLATTDGLGRGYVNQLREAPGSSTYDSVENNYDTDGRPNRVTLPYAGSAGQTNSSAPSTTRTFDALGRKTQITNGSTPPAQTTFTYTQNDTYRTRGPAPTGENAKRRQYEYDALGNLTSVCEITSVTGSGTCGQTSAVTGFWTKYTYDADNNLTGVTQNAQSSTTQTRSYTYDGLNRMTSETNPETGNAAVTYTYDTDTTCGTSKGDLVKKVDPVGDTTCYTYDALHRMTSTTYSGPYAASTPNRYFTYDSATVNGTSMVNVKARQAEAYTATCQTCSKITDIGFSYTARGELSDEYESDPHSGGYYHLTQTYWANGAPDQLSGLSGLPAITYNPDGKGRIYSASAASGQNPVSSTNYSVANLATQVNFGSSDDDAFTYDPNTNRMTEYQFKVNSQALNGQLLWNAMGTLASLTITDPFDSGDNQTCSYVYDDEGRIASVNCGSVWSQTFSYDPFGNINKSGSSSFQATYNEATNRMSEIGSSTPSYDANGDVTNDFLHSYAWDANGRPVTVDTVAVTYDALGRMAEQNRGGSYTEIVYSPSGAKLALMTGLSTLQKGYVPLTGGSMAVYNSSGLAYYRHSDWIGSSRLASTPGRAIYFDGAYAPFGEGYAETGTTDLSFTGMNQDTVSNLYDFPTREYGTQGRWPSPDPAGIGSVDPRNPQSWNRYAYVLNNPLGFMDPTGECPQNKNNNQNQNNQKQQNPVVGYVCGSSASQLVLGSMATGGLAGAWHGAVDGVVVGTAAEPGGGTVIVGALGALVGGILGAAGGALTGGFTAIACQAAGAYSGG